MSRRSSSASVVCVCAVLALSAFSQPQNSTKKTWSPPLAGDGHPDLQGNWTNTFATPLERPKELADRQLLTDQEVAELNRRAHLGFGDGHVMVVPSERSLTTLLNDPTQFGNTPNYDSSFFTELEFENRTSLITDPRTGRLPEYTPGGQRRAHGHTASPESVKALPPDTRCITFGVPRIAGVAGTPSASIYAYFQIVQTRDYFLFFTEAVHEARVIPLDGRPHQPQSLRSWDGDSRGRWEDDTLVFDTTNFRPETNFLGSGENLHLIERLRLVGPDELEYTIQVEDPTTWTRPWSAVVRLRRTREPLYEFACHEGNASIIEAIVAHPGTGK